MYDKLRTIHLVMFKLSYVFKQISGMLVLLSSLEKVRKYLSVSTVIERLFPYIRSKFRKVTKK